MIGKYLTFVIVLVIAVLVRKVQIRIETLSLPPFFTFNDQGCSLVGGDIGLIGSEDLALGKHSILFITSGDLETTFEHGAQQADNGAIWMMDARQGAAGVPTKVELINFPAGKLFQPHGFDVSNATDRMYVISHQGTRSSVEVFSIQYQVPCVTADTWSCPPASLTHLTSVQSHLFPSYGINDVVELDDDHVYVTQWQHDSFPQHGKRHPAGLRDIVNTLLEIVFTMFGLQFTHVHVCSIKDSVCSVASDQTFVGANGITINNER